MNITGGQVYQKGVKRRRHSSQEERDDVAFRAWLRKQPCCICGRFKEWPLGEGRSQAAHVRLGGRGGVSIKPLLSSVPLCIDDHGLQHNESHEIFGNKDFWVNLADLYLARWRQFLTYGELA